MANQTITTNLTISQVISNGLNSGNNITINNGATLTVDVAPTVLIGQININDGVLLLDGANATDPIVFVGEETEEININGAGLIRSTLGWWIHPTTSNGNANQTFDFSAYFANSNVGADVFSGVWVETGRRINYFNGGGVAPKVGDWLYSETNQLTHGRVIDVVGDEISGYMIVRFLTGSLADGEIIEIHSIQENKGSDFQISWVGRANGVDVLEPDVWQEFGNSYQNATDYLTSLGSGISGFGYSQRWQDNQVAFGNGTNGFIPPSGARIKVPMVHICTSNLAEYAIGNTKFTSNAANVYEFETVNGGDIDIEGISFGSAHCEDNLGASFTAKYCAANHAFGNYGCLSRVSMEHCIFVASPEWDTRSAARSMPAIVDLTAGADVIDCLSLTMNDAGETTNMGGQTSLNVNYTRCIAIGLTNTTEIEFIRIDGLVIDDLVVCGTQLVLPTVFNADIKNLRTQRNLDGSVGGTDMIVMSTSSNNLKITGWEFIGHSSPDDSKISISDSSRIEVRCFHFRDRPFDNEALGGTQGEEFVNIAGLCNNILISRCYQDRGSPNEFAIIASGTSKNVTIQNCGGEFSGEVEPDGINTTFKGFLGGSGSLGATTGVETDFPGTAGANFGDVFESNTKGYIYYRNVPGSQELPLTILAGNPKFTKDGDVDVVAGDQWECEMHYSSLGHSAFSGVVTTTRNGTAAAEGADNWTAVDIDFQYDTGVGYNGTWLDLRTPSNLTSITGIEDGVRLKLRFTATATQTNGQAITIHTTTSSAVQANNIYPLDQVDVNVKVLDQITLLPIQGARVYAVYGASGSETQGDLFINTVTNADGVASQKFSFKEVNQSISGWVRKASSAPYYKQSLISQVITENGIDFTVLMQLDQ